MSAAPAPRYRLVTVAISNGCDLMRWLLDRAGLDFQEELHVPLLHVVATLRRRAGVEVPVIVAPGTIWKSPFGELDAIDAHAPAGAKVYGETIEERLENNAWLRRIIPSFYGYPRQYVYHYVLQDRHVMTPIAVYGAPWWERMVVRWLYWLWAPLLRRALGITPRVIADAPAALAKAMDDVAAELARRGTPFMAGAAPGGVDIVMATLIAPLVFPPEYGGMAPPLDEVKPVLRDWVLANRAHPAGVYGLAVYAANRPLYRGLP